MAESRTLARPYAEAVFNLATEHDRLAQWSGMLRLLAEVTSDPRVATLAADPRVSKRHLAGLLLDICGARLNEDGKNLVRLLIENERLELLADITAVFEALRADAEGTIEVEAISAFRLSDKEIQNIAQAVKAKLGREVKLTSSVDRSLMGGVVIRAGDLVIDGSVKGRLHGLAAQLVQ